MPVGDAPRMSPDTRPKLRSSYLLRVLSGPVQHAGCRYELRELRSGEVRSFESLAALRRHLGEAEAVVALASARGKGGRRETE